MSKQIDLIRKISLSLIVILTFSACGSSTSEKIDAKDRSEEQSCDTVRAIRNDIEQAKIDMVNGDLDMGEAMLEFGMIRTRIEFLQESVPEGDLKEAIDRWALSRQMMSEGEGDETQMKEENDAAVIALEKMCE